MDERKNMINDTIGIYARVDSGKTSLTEALLYTYGNIKELGKVDSRSTLLDTDELEKKRGITIFSKSAILRDGKFSHSLIDTPGHGDFSSQLLYTLWVIDMAILIVDATYGVDYYTKILWTRLRERKIPIVIFVNKMDALKGEKEKIEKAILHLTSKRAVPWQSPRYLEDAAIFSEDLTEVLLQESPNLQMARDVALDLACKGEIVPVI